MAEGEFHESANLAALWSLPVLFVCENNLYAMGTALARSEARPDLCLKAEACGLAARRVDGMDAQAVAAAAREAVAALRAGGPPMFLEMQTYRFRAHSMFDPELYRSREEVEAWRRRCPIETLAASLRATAELDANLRQALEDEVRAEIEDAVAFAQAGTWEPVENLLDHVGARRAGGAA